MAANAITVQQALMKIAEDAGEFQSAFIRTVTSQTVLVLGGVSIGERETFKYALATTPGGGIRTVTAYNEASETITLASGFDVTVAAGERVTLAWWDARRREMALAAINEAIRQSWGRFGRETIVNAASATLIFASGVFLYALPAAVDELWEIGVEQGNGAIHWLQQRDLWRITGEAGAYQLLCMEGADLPGRYAGYKICLRYLSREPEVEGESDTIRLPLDYFNLASYLYMVKVGPPPDASPGALQGWNARVGQLRADADAAQERLEVGRPRRPVRRVFERRR